MERRRTIVVAAIGSMLATSTAHAEPAAEPPPDTIFVEWVGPTGRYSVDYERLIVPDLAARVGFSYTDATQCDGKVGCPWLNGGKLAATMPGARLWQFPLLATYLGIGNRRHVLELAGGGAITHFADAGTATRTSGYVAAVVGYRHQPLGEAGVQFRGGLTLVVGNLQSFAVMPYLSLGVGF